MCTVLGLVHYIIRSTKWIEGPAFAFIFTVCFFVLCIWMCKMVVFWCTFKFRFAYQQWNKGLFWDKKSKNDLSEYSSLLLSESDWWNLFHSELKIRYSTTLLRLWQFRPWLKSCIFKCISWLNISCFGWCLGVSERRSQWGLSNGHNDLLNR